MLTILALCLATITLLTLFVVAMYITAIWEMGMDPIPAVRITAWFLVVMLLTIVLILNP
jgi:hypothetical protein